MTIRVPYHKYTNVSALAACALALGCGGGVTDEEIGTDEWEIVGGDDTDISDVPWQVLLELDLGGGTGLCGGTILDEEWVLTAAHCVDGLDETDVTVFAGITDPDDTSSGQEVSVSDIEIYPGFSSVDHGKDAALLNLSSALDLSGADARAIRVATHADAGSFAANAPGLISGYGTLSSGGPLADQLQSVDVPIVPNPIAVDAYAEWPDVPFEIDEEAIGGDQLAAGILGTGGVDSCQGDSGGPLAVEAIRGPLLAGVVSWGIGCADPDYPGMYARVSSFASWIAGHLGTPTNLKWLVDTDQDGTTELQEQFGWAFDRPVPGDYNGDGVTDFAVVRADNSEWDWYLDTNRDGTTDVVKQYGLVTDEPVPADYDGDGETDFAVVRAGEFGSSWAWYVDTDRDGATELHVYFGVYTDVPVPGDYDGDGATDLAVVRKSGSHWKWYVDTNRDGTTDFSETWALVTDRPVAADYDGDGATDFAVVRRGSTNLTWYADTDHDGTTDIAKTWALDSDWPLPADYDGDGKTDFGVVRRGSSNWTWYADTTRNGTTDLSETYGLVSDLPLIGDFDGDGETDFAVGRNVN